MTAKDEGRMTATTKCSCVDEFGAPSSAEGESFGREEADCCHLRDMRRWSCFSRIWTIDATARASFSSMMRPSGSLDSRIMTMSSRSKSSTRSKSAAVSGSQHSPNVHMDTDKAETTEAEAMAETDQGKSNGQAGRQTDRQIDRPAKCAEIDYKKADRWIDPYMDVRVRDDSCGSG